MLVKSLAAASLLSASALAAPLVARDTCVAGTTELWSSSSAYVCVDTTSIVDNGLALVDVGLEIAETLAKDVADWLTTHVEVQVAVSRLARRDGVNADGQLTTGVNVAGTTAGVGASGAAAVDGSGVHAGGAAAVDANIPGIATASGDAAAGVAVDGNGVAAGVTGGANADVAGSQVGAAANVGAQVNGDRVAVGAQAGGDADVLGLINAQVGAQAGAALSPEQLAVALQGTANALGGTVNALVNGTLNAALTGLNVAGGLTVDLSALLLGLLGINVGAQANVGISARSINLGGQVATLVGGSATYLSTGLIGSLTLDWQTASSSSSKRDISLVHTTYWAPNSSVDAAALSWDETYQLVLHSFTALPSGASEVCGYFGGNAALGAFHHWTGVSAQLDTCASLA
ncbi:uncharacterized protein JCM10292_002502 [Rhodotorula paludigena]|uniref:uncharacterized protein n=1 Tax=Rhodotorula paludigena TaxID=86838 RepID=UPI00317EF2A9